MGWVTVTHGLQLRDERRRQTITGQPEALLGVVRPDEDSVATLQVGVEVEGSRTNANTRRLEADHLHRVFEGTTASEHL